MMIREALWFRILLDDARLTILIVEIMMIAKQL